MGRVLIITRVGDSHALAVAAHLKRQSVPCDIWYTHLFPAQQFRTFSADGESIRYSVSDEILQSEIGDYSCVWHRRSTPPECDALEVHPHDRPYAALQAETFHKMSAGLLASAASIWPDVRWVNDPGCASRCESKMLQIALARSVGLSAPPTIVSNDPAAIRDFVSGHGSAVCKSLIPFTWFEGGDVLVNDSNRIDLEAMPSDHVLSASPEIFQVEVERTRELRLYRSLCGRTAEAVGAVWTHAQPIGHDSDAIQ